MAGECPIARHIQAQGQRICQEDTEGTLALKGVAQQPSGHAWWVGGGGRLSRRSPGSRPVRSQLGHPH